MSTRPPLRGGRGFRGRRNFSDQRTSAVSGDSHFSSVRDANNIISNNNNNNYKISYNAQNYSYQNNQNISRGGNSNYVSSRGGGGGNFGPRTSPLYNRGPNQSGAGVNRLKPADFRAWEFAKLPLPPNSERFVVISYNILADYLANGHRNLYFHIPHRFMSWEWRKSNILFELKLWSPDIMCFQEVDKFQELEDDLRVRGYSGFWKMRTGEPVDGCAIFFRTTRFKLMFEDSIEFNKHGMRDNVAQICVLESVAQTECGNTMSSSSSGGPNRVVVCNIHVLYNPRRGEMKLGQVRMLLERAQAVSKTWDDAPIVLCGDFNCTPKSPLYNFISQQKLDILQVKRDQVSGQASAEIHQPAKLYNNHFRGQPAGNMANSTTVLSNILEKHVMDTGNLKNSLSNNSSDSSPTSVPVSVVGPTINLPSQPVDDRNTSSTFNYVKTDEKDVHLNELDESLKKNKGLGEDAKNFMSALHDDEHVSPPTLDEAVLKPDIAVKGKPLYDPSQWTAMEIATATGSTDCTTLEHPLKLQSTYSEVLDTSGTRDLCGEPLVTCYNSCFMGTVDYIWRSEGLQTIKVLAPILKDVMQTSRGFPTKKWGSDHIALATELAFTK